MKRLLALALLAAGCHANPPPNIESFTADNLNPPAGAEVHLSWVVHDALDVSISPEPGKVTASPATVLPRQPTTYTLRATNTIGMATKSVTVNARASGAASIQLFSVTPSQAPAGTPRTLSWKIHDGVQMTLAGGAVGGADGGIGVVDVGQFGDAPAQTTTYTLSATSSAGFAPAQVTAQAVARVVEAASISSFTATPQPLPQGDPATLKWAGTALSWSIAANGVTTNLGVAKSLVVRPSQTTTYALTGKGPGGNAGPQQLTVTVTPRAATTLAYTAPPQGTEQLRLIADCASCTPMTLRLVAAQATALRGVALNLPLDSTKLSLDPATFGTALDAGKAVLGTGPLDNTLVLGAALEGNGTAPAADRSLLSGAELVHFAVALQPQGGQGIVFDGAAAFAAFIQSASGRTPGGIAVGKLEAK